MLSIGKLGQGQEQYYLEAVADGAEEYYVHKGETPGRWLGGGALLLGLRGQVEGADFTSVLRAVDPVHDEPLGSRPTRRSVPGFDLTFSAPKSVSVLAALGTDDVARRMRVAHDAAVLDALAYLERTASHGRRGHAGERRVLTSGFVAAAFRHRTSRAGDPNLHTHVVVGNRVLGSDGKWSALDARSLYVQAKTAGTLYQSSLRHRLRDLELAWTVAPTGLGELDTVPLAVRREFSRRRREIEAELDRRGLRSAAAAQAATLDTRVAKDAEQDAEGLLAQWRHRVADHGWDPSRLAHERLRDEPFTRALVSMLGPEGLTARASTFSERDVLRAVATALNAGASVAQVEAATRDVLAHPEVVELASGPSGPAAGQTLLRAARSAAGRLIPLGASERRFTTRELLSLEQRIVARALAGRAASAAVTDARHVQEALERRPHLNDEQRDLVRRLCTQPELVQVVEAPAGAGKTTALAAVVDALAQAGVPAVGTTLSARAAGVLRDETGLRTYTTTRLLADLRDPTAGGLARRSVVVVDEAGQVGTRALAVLLDAIAQVSGKLVLVGDPHQLPEIDAGGAYRGLLDRLPVQRLTANHRQRDPDEVARLAELRSGDVGAALQQYDDAGRVTRGVDGDAVRAALVADWAAAYLAAGGRDVEASRADVVMLALTNADADDLNRRARAVLQEAGRLGGDIVTVGARDFAVGDHVVTRWNNRRLGVLNGERWTVQGWSKTGLLLRPVGRDGDGVALPWSYAADHPSRLQHAYALTTAVSQGSTVESAFVLGSDVTYREAGYTAASRARSITRFYVVAPEIEPHETDHLRYRPRAAPDPLAAFVEALNRSAARPMALDTDLVPEPRYVEHPGDRDRSAVIGLDDERQV